MQCTAIQEQRTQDLLRFENVSIFEEARGLPIDQLMDANDAQIFASPYSIYGLGPSVDRDCVTHDPKMALIQGLLFTAPTINYAQDLDFIRNSVRRRNQSHWERSIPSSL